VLPETFLPNLVLFLGGQAAAWIYLRTGRFVLGGGAMAALWVLADWALVARLVFAETGPHFTATLLAMQLVALLTIAALAFGRWRARWSKTAKQRPELFAAGLTQYLRNELDGAAVTFRRIVRANPWDAAAWVALGNVRRSEGKTRVARACYRRARCVDRQREYADFIDLQQKRLPAAAPLRAVPTPVNAPAPRARRPRSHPAQS